LRHRGLRSESWRRFFRQRTTSWGVGILTFLVIVALAAPLIGLSIRTGSSTSFIHEPLALVTFLLAPDFLSRDIWSRVAYGARVSLGIGALAR